MPNDFQMINNERIQLTDEEQTAVDSERLHQINVVKPVQKFKELRRDRNQLLNDTDYIFGSDTPDMSDDKKNEWRSFRQDLRDLPANTSDPFNITWPTKPS